MFIGPIIILFLLLLNVIVFYLNGEGCCVLGPRLPLGKALERLTIGLGTTSRVGEIRPSSKVESVVIFHYLPARSVTTALKGFIELPMEKLAKVLETVLTITVIISPVETSNSKNPIIKCR